MDLQGWDKLTKKDEKRDSCETGLSNVFTS